jgi:DNA-binding transcriptional regulator YiaG
MPNIAKVLKEEISRIARHEAKIAVTPIRKPTIRVRRDVADLKVRLAALEKVSQALQAALTKLQPAAPSTPVAEKGWISGKGIRSLRKRLGLSQGEFARLVDASSQAVYTWESKPGMLKLREATRAAVFAIRGIGAREARKRLAAMTVPPKAKKRAAKRRK